MTKSIYLANPYGFSKQQRELLIPEIIEALERLHPDIEVREPFAEISGFEIKNPYKIALHCASMVYRCDAVFAVLNGEPPDVGVMFELGIAQSQDKTVFLFRDDFRRCSDNGVVPVNLMVLSCFSSELSARNHFYTNLEKLDDPTKALYRWVNQ